MLLVADDSRSFQCQKLSCQAVCALFLLDSEDCVYVRDDDVRYVCLHFLLGCHVVTIEMFDSV